MVLLMGFQGAALQQSRPMSTIFSSKSIRGLNRKFLAWIEHAP